MIIASFFLVLLLMQDTSTTTAADNKPKESPEHLYARQLYEAAKKRAGELSAEIRPIQDKMVKLLGSCSSSDIKCMKSTLPQVTALQEQGRPLQKEYEVLAEHLIPTLKLRFEHADECATLYANTIDRKVSDLTTRESKLIETCTASDLYPPKRADVKMSEK